MKTHKNGTVTIDIGHDQPKITSAMISKHKKKKDKELMAEAVRRDSSKPLEPVEHDSNIARLLKTRNLEEFEMAILQGADEFGAVYDEYGNRILLRKGIGQSIVFTEEELPLVNDCILSHSHPTGESLSRKDVFFAVSNNLMEIRVVGFNPYGEKQVFILKRPGKGWPSLTEVERWTMANYAAVYDRSFFDLFELFEAGKVRRKEVNYLQRSEAAKGLANHFGMPYLHRRLEGDMP